MPSVEVGGLKIEYESLGQPGDPAIVLIMGLGMQLIAWPDEFCEALVVRGFRIIRFDNRDSGLSGKVHLRKRPNLMLAFASTWLGLPVRAPYTLGDMAADTAGLLDALGVARAHIVGASMGGMIAQVFAARYPQRTLSLTSIMSSSGNKKVSRAKKEAMQALLSRPPDPKDEESVIEHLVGVFGVIGSPGYPAEHGELRRRIGRSVRRAYDPAGTARQLLAILASGDRRRLLAKIEAPTLVIHGAADPLVPLAAGKDTAAHIRGARLKIIEGMGHDLPAVLLPELVEAIAAHCRQAQTR